MIISNPGSDDRIKSIDGVYIQPDLVDEADIDMGKMQTKSPIWKDTQKDEFYNNMHLLTDDGKMVRVEWVDIGAWDIQTVAQKAVTINATPSKVLGVLAFIRNDAGTQYNSFTIQAMSTGMLYHIGGQWYINRSNWGTPSWGNYQSTAFSRGQMLVFYRD